MDGVPGFWMNETSGVIAPVVQAYLNGARLGERPVAIMRAYLRQWVNAPGFIGAEVEALRADIDSIQTHDGLKCWLDRALDAGIDPL